MWDSLPVLERFRHVSWIHDNLLCIMGGFEHHSPATAVNKQLSLNISEIVDLKKKFIQKTPTLIFINEEDKSRNKEKDSEHTLRDKIEKIVTMEESNPSRSKSCTKAGYVDDNLNFTMSSTVYASMFCETNLHGGKRHVIRSVSVKNLKAEARSLIPKNEILFGPYTEKFESQNIKSKALAQTFIDSLLKPENWVLEDMNRSFPFKKKDILLLIAQCAKIVKAQPTVLRVNTPVKVFGDIHGQYRDIMRFFDLWRGPIESCRGGDIESYDYLFLGDYIDRGNNSLETICLLMALKVKYPDQIHFIRGNHEDLSINQAFGFAEECEERLNDDLEAEFSVFQTINRFFEWLPLAAVIENKILCLHGGIGKKLASISEIENLKRPIEIVHEVSNAKEQILIDILWSDPTDNDKELGIQSDSPRDPCDTGFVVKFGPDRVEKFLKDNDLIMILRGHECVMDGIERFAKGQLITVFSATDYCGKYKNAGGALFIQKNYEIIPKLIYPIDNVVDERWLSNRSQSQSDQTRSTSDLSFNKIYY